MNESFIAVLGIDAISPTTFISYPLAIKGNQ